MKPKADLVHLAAGMAAKAVALRAEADQLDADADALLALASGARPPGGYGWIPLSAAQGGEQWTEIRCFGGKMHGRLRLSVADPCVTLSTHSDVK